MSRQAGIKDQINYQMITIQEAAQYTGLAVKTLYTMVSQRRIPYFKIGRLVKFNREDLNDWLKRQMVMPMPTKIG